MNDQKSVLALCAAFFLVGCASKAAPVSPPQPVNGQCGTTQDVCRLGTPSGTGDTTSPYGWMCLGINRGMDAPCSVPIAKKDPNEIFAGQYALEEKVKAEPLRGLMTIADGTLRHPDCYRPYCHAYVMERFALEMGIPEENLRVLPLDDPAVREETLVFVHPSDFATGLSNRAREIIAQHNSLVVAAAGNTKTFGDRDLWYPDHDRWRFDRFDQAMLTFRTGKLIVAKYAEVDNLGNVIPYEGNVRCGLAKESCYSIMVPTTAWCDDDGSCYRPDLGTSGASVNLGSLAFYLFQLWDTPQEVVGVLNTCAEDVGEPGIDEEFGRGIVSVVCDTVQHKERQIVSSSLQTSYATSPVLSAMLGSSKVPLQTSARSFFYALNPYSGTGHVGKQFSVGGNDLFLSGGLSRMPLGVRTLLRQAHRVPFMEIGSRRPFYERNGHKLSLLGTYGQSAEDGFSVRAGHVGLRYELTLPSAAFSLHTGYRLANGQLGLPGYEVVGAAPVPFTTGAPELSVSLALGL